MRSESEFQTHRSGVQLYSFAKDDNLFGKYPYKSYPQLKFKESELPAKFMGHIFKIRKGGQDIVVNVKHKTAFIEECDSETGQFHLTRLSDETIVHDGRNWKEVKSEIMKDDFETKCAWYCKCVRWAFEKDMKEEKDRVKLIKILRALQKKLGDDTAPLPETSS